MVSKMRCSLQICLKCLLVAMTCLLSTLQRRGTPFLWVSTTCPSVSASPSSSKGKETHLGARHSFWWIFLIKKLFICLYVHFHCAVSCLLIADSALSKLPARSAEPTCWWTPVNGRSGWWTACSLSQWTNTEKSAPSSPVGESCCWKNRFM